MKKEKILDLLAKNKAILRSRFKVESLSLFGSSARNDDGPESDIDLLVSFDTPPGLFRFLELKLFLEDLFLCPVDLVTRNGLKKELRKQILEEALDAI